MKGSCFVLAIAGFVALPVRNKNGVTTQNVVVLAMGDEYSAACAVGLDVGIRNVQYLPF
jgi:hypothetical protein